MRGLDQSVLSSPEYDLRLTIINDLCYKDNREVIIVGEISNGDVFDEIRAFGALKTLRVQSLYFDNF